MFRVSQTCFQFFCLHVRSSYHKSLNHNAINTLEAHNENRLWTLFGSPNVCRERDCLISETVYACTYWNINDLFAYYLRAHTVADRMLCLNAEEEAWCKAVDIINAWTPATLGLSVGQMRLLQIAMSEGNQPPNDGEKEPR